MKNSLIYLQKVENYIIVVSFAFMVFCSFAQVVNRNFFQLPIAWFDEIAVTALVNKFKGVSKLFIQIISKIIVTIFSSAILFYSINMVKIQAVSGQTTAALHLPMSVPYMALVISFGIITVVQFILTIKMIRDLVKGNIPMEDGGVEK